ncbi:hypothetical protein [Streptomyces cellostaticus]|uniref:hypothetical protein n=1 Tax=Streptomyces cellostaticus TaxID=67285 RepID=UPI002026E798|nr:hypothetical protein [Streptomyces cellostaticus]
MFTTQRIATVSGLVGSVAALCLGAGQAHAHGLPGGCHGTAPGGTVCVQENDSHVDKDGTHVLRQKQDCSTVDRPHVVFSADEITGEESASTGQVVDCSNRAELPKGFRKPHIGF